MSVKRIATIMVCALLWLGAAAQVNVRIVGTSENAVGKRIGLYSYSDMLTMAEQLEDADWVDSTGAFELECYLNYPRLMFLQVDNYSQSFYVEPGRTYEVYLPEFDWTIDEQRNIFLAPEPLPVEFLNIPADELNLRLGSFEHTVDSFIVANRIHFDPKFHPNRYYFDTLCMMVGPHDSNDFYGRYVDYTLAEMQLTMRFVSRKKLIAKYVTDQPIRYHDEQYMRLFLALYRESISMGTSRIPLWRLVDMVEHEDLARYIDTIGLDPLLRNEQVRELAVLEALKESYYDAVYDRTHVRHMVERLADETKFGEHRILAENLLASFTSHEKGSEVPATVLPDKERNMVNLDSLRGQWVYISFVRVGDPNSQAELETMAHFYDTIRSSHPDVQFVSICCDREFQKMYHLLNNSRRGHRYNWLWLHFDGDYRLLENYGVVSYPTFVLIDPQGHRVYDFTPAPATGFLLNAPWDMDDKPNMDNDINYFNR